MIRRILVPTDFSPCAEHALEYAISLGRALGASVHVLNTYMPVLIPGPDAAVLMPSPETVSGMSTEAQSRVDALLARHQGSGCQLTGEASYGPPAETIVDATAGGAYDLIVMGTHGRTGLGHILLGSVAERVVRTAVCPVLTVREPRKEAHAHV